MPKNPPLQSSSSKKPFQSLHSTDPLIYHQQPTPGKIAVIPTKSCKTVQDLSLAYTPGVAQPCLEIHKDPTTAYKYTSKGNLVAVISNGTAVLGLGDIGPLAGKPVMEGKGVLFKRFANIDAFDIEINEKDPEKLVQIIASLEPTFGGINLEDIKAPECFYVEQELIKRLSIPLMHDDQHGTAIVAGAGLINALYISKRKIQEVKIIFSGAGAAAIACAKFFIELGAKRENIFLVDSKGVVTTQRVHELSAEKKEFMKNTAAITLADALVGADVFVGVSKGNVLTPTMLRAMKPSPIVFAMANPTPEIAYELAIKEVPGVIMATGRSDYPNQINNVLGFPYLFRAAFDVRATAITPKMKIAAAKGLAALARKKVPADVEKIYGRKFEFGPEYLIPKPLDSRILSNITPLIAKSAMDEGVAQQPIKDMGEYVASLKKLAQKLKKGKF
ncbi:malate dehydrogenase [Candidatus Woesearchaeota archaeon]|nr:malate dehydrogenase [Candidatus Woesearchaeota archaeon]